MAIHWMGKVVSRRTLAATAGRASRMLVSLSEQASLRRKVRLIRRAVLATVLVGLCVTWLTGLADRRIDEIVDSGRTYNWSEMPDDGRPAFVALTPSPRSSLTRSPRSSIPLPANAPFLQRVTWRVTWRLSDAYASLKYRFAGMNPAACRFPPSASRRYQIQEPLQRCADVTGTRYLIAREASRTISLGNTGTLNGAQWVATVEQALRNEGYLLIPEGRRLVKVIPKDNLEEYRKAGLVKLKP